MTITPQLKKWLIDKRGVKADATDEVLQKAVGDAFAEGDLTPEDYTKMSTDPEAAAFAQKLDKVADNLGRLAELLTPKATETKPAEKAEGQAKCPACDWTGTAPEDGKCPKCGADLSGAAKSTTPRTKEVKPGATDMAKKVAMMAGTPTEPDETRIRTKRAIESYDATKTVLTYPQRTRQGKGHVLAGQAVKSGGRELAISQQDKALSGMWAKFQIMAATPRIAGSAQRAFELLPEHQKDLMDYLCTDAEWDDSDDRHFRTRKGYPGGIKALIDDSTSGGLEAAPIVFDDQVIQAPLLNGELYPLVEEVPIERGRRIEGVSTGTVTGSWGGVDDTAISLFNTASYVAAFDTTIYRWEGAIRIGLDFLSDTPIDFNAHVTAQYGERLLEDLDDVIATGNGTTQPEGIMTKSGTTSVAFGGTTTIGAYESLRFGVTKQEHKALANTAVFCGTETSYQRAMALAVGASDNRRLFSTNELPNYDGYSFMGRPYKVNGSMANNQLFYAIMGRYRMYRRKGLTVRTSMEGDTLLRANEVLIVAQSRYGGALTRAATAAVSTTAAA